MNPKLVKFAVELQVGEKIEKDTEKSISFSDVGLSKCFNFVNTATVPITIKTND